MSAGDRAALEAQVQAWLAAKLREHEPAAEYTGCRCGSAYISPHADHVAHVLASRVLALAERCARLGVEGEWFTVGGVPNVPVDAEAMVAEILARALAEEPT